MKKSPKGSIYLLQEREFIKTGEPIYKIGRTGHHPNQRLSKYPKDSEIHIVIGVVDNLAAEYTLLKKFRASFTNRVDIGDEYFEGDPSKMKEIIVKYSLGVIEATEEDLSDTSEEVLVLEIPNEQSPNELMIESTPAPSLIDLRKECQSLGLAISGTRDQLTKKLDLYHSIKGLPNSALEALANAAGFKLTKKDKDAKVEYVKKFLSAKRGSNANTSKSSGAEEEEKSVDDSTGAKETDLEQRIKTLEKDNEELKIELNKLKEDIQKLEFLVKGLLGGEQHR